MKRIAFLFGIAFLALAFLVTGAELAARAIGNANGEADTVLLSLAEVWRILAPDSYAALLDSPNWPKVRLALNLPGWLLFGAPGLALVIVFHGRDGDPQTRAQRREHEESLFLFDELAGAAQKEGYGDLQDDMAPSHPADTVPAEAHFADNPIEDELLPERDFLFDPAMPKSTPDDKTD